MLGFHGLSVAPISALVIADEGAIAGFLNAAFTTSGALTGVGALSGSTIPAFSTLGVLVGSGALSGALSTAFTTAAALGGTGGLSGSTTLTFTLSGALGISPISGAVSISFSVSGVLRSFVPTWWTNTDGLTIVYGTQEGSSYPSDIKVTSSDTPGKLIYGRSKRHGYRK